jgi:hypothetical protein
LDLLTGGEGFQVLALTGDLFVLLAYLFGLPLQNFRAACRQNQRRKEH